MNGRVGGLTGATVPHNTGCASGGGALCAITSDCFDVRTAAAPSSAPVLSTVLRSTPSSSVRDISPNLRYWSDVGSSALSSWAPGDARQRSATLRTRRECNSEFHAPTDRARTSSGAACSRDSPPATQSFANPVRVSIDLVRRDCGSGLSLILVVAL